MLILFGSRASESIIAVVAFICGYCHVEAPQNVVTRVNRLTLFFVPLFALSTKYLNQCTNCGGRTELSAEHARHAVSSAESHR